MRTIKHPLSGAVYDLDVDGTIQVVTPDGRRGVFDAAACGSPATSSRPTRTCACGSAARSCPTGSSRRPTRSSTKDPSRRRGSTHDDDRPTHPAPPAPPARRTRSCSTTTAGRRTCRSCCAGRATSSSAAPTSPRALRQPRVPRAREGEDVEADVADGVPRGGHPRGRRHARLRHLRPVDPRRPLAPPTEIKAYYNACLHRGRQLKEHDGNSTRAALPRSTATAGTSTAR